MLKICLHHTYNNYLHVTAKLVKRFGIKQLPEASYKLRFATCIIEG